MKSILPLLAWLVAGMLIPSARAQLPAGKPVLLFFAGGQNNMGGHGYELDPRLAHVQNVWVRTAVPPDSIQPDWAPLGHQIQLDGSVPIRTPIGPEAAFGDAVAQAFPGHTVAILKVYRSGAPIGYWLPAEGGKNHCHQLITTLIPAVVGDLDALVKSGKIPSYRVGGILWMQGEGDANGINRPDGEYIAQLRQLDTSIRGLLRAADDVPFVLGRLSKQLSPAVTRDSGGLRVSRAKGGALPENVDFVDDGLPRGPIWFAEQLDRIRGEQTAFATERPRAAWVDTDDIRMRDEFNFQADAYVELGKRFAAAIIPLIKR